MPTAFVMRTPTLPTLGPGPYTLYFDLRADIGGSFDTTTIVSVATDAGTSFVGLFSASSTGVSTPEWVSHVVDLSDFLAGEETCELHLDYFGGASTSHYRRVHVTDGAGAVVYGEFPLGYPYPGTSAIQDTAVSAGTNPEEAEAGAVNAYEWNAQTLSVDIRSDVLLHIRARTGLVADHLTFGPTGSGQPFVVPAGVTSITAEAWGAQGQDYIDTDVHLGGRGGYIKAALAVTPGETLTVFPGGVSIGSTAYPASGPGGDNGGGAGYGNSGKGGGGKSDVKRGSTTLLVAGGGGGATRSSAGGDGGASTGHAGANGGAPATTGGGGGATSAGGAAGHECSDMPGYTQATAGSAGTGGEGGYISSGFYGGGGGGGGKFGGGGGGYGNGLIGGGGGGGGSNDTTGAVIASSQGAASGPGKVRISW